VLSVSPLAEPLQLGPEFLFFFSSSIPGFIGVSHPSSAAQALMANGQGWNSVTLIGILKLSPAGLRKSQNGHSYITFGVGAPQPMNEDLAWVQCIAWGERAEAITMWEKKHVWVMGQLTMSKDTNGSGGWYTSVVIQEIRDPNTGKEILGS
jgi:hypothetical protein